MPRASLDTATILAKFMSRDPHQVWEAAHAAIRAPRHEQLLLVPDLPVIRQATQGLDLGGALFPNTQHLEHALRVLEAARDGRCTCEGYPTWLFYDPTEEAAVGAVEILSTSAPDWHMTYSCRCLTCGRTYEVEQGEYHYTWWQWRERPAAGVASAKAPATSA